MSIKERLVGLERKALLGMGLSIALFIWVVNKTFRITVWRVDKYALGSFISRINVMLMEKHYGKLPLILILWPPSPTAPALRQQVKNGLSTLKGIVIIEEASWISRSLAKTIQIAQNSAYSHPAVRRLLPLMVTGTFGDPRVTPLILPSQFSCVAKFVRGRNPAVQLNMQELDSNNCFVCMNVRDGDWESSLGTSSIGQSYRNWKFDQYHSVVYKLASLGFKVVRTGRSRTKANLRKSWFYDYATHVDASDLTDVWLYENCAFAIDFGCSGVSELGNSFDKPLLSFNFFPLGNFVPVSKWMVAPPLLRRNGTEKLASLEEYFFAGHTLESISSRGYRVEPIPANLAAKVVSEFYSYLYALPLANSDSRHLAQLASDLVESVYTKLGFENANEIAAHYRLSSTFLKTYENELFTKLRMK